MDASGPPLVYRTLSEPLRWQILTELARGDRRVGELTEVTGKPQNAVSYHLAALRAAGAVTARRSSFDARDIYYRAELERCRAMLAAAAATIHPSFDAPDTRAPRQITKCSSVLFLCTGNSARSQIAEALATHLSAGTINATSAGSHPKQLHPNAVRVLADRGIDIASHAVTPMTAVAGRRFDRVITLCDKVREICPEFPGRPSASHWSIADPASSGADDEITYPAFVDVADQIEARVALLLAELATTMTGDS